jgi:hypothetical protein
MGPSRRSGESPCPPPFGVDVDHRDQFTVIAMDATVEDAGE